MRPNFGNLSRFEGLTAIIGFGTQRSNFPFVGWCRTVGTMSCSEDKIRCDEDATTAVISSIGIDAAGEPFVFSSGGFGSSYDANFRIGFVVVDVFVVMVMMVVLEKRGYSGRFVFGVNEG